MPRPLLATFCGLLLLLAAHGAHADLTADLAGRDGRVRLSAPAREGVRGDGAHIRVDGGTITVAHEFDGLVHLVLDLRNGRVRDLDTRVGGTPGRRERQATDLGAYPPADVAVFCLDLATRPDDVDVAEDAVTAAVLVDAEVWPRLADLARDRDLEGEVRQSAMFWLGVQAGDKMADELAGIATDDREDVEIREHAVFALHQALENDVERALGTLGGIATGHAHPDVRRSALFWLAQHDDPRVVDLFERILLD